MSKAGPLYRTLADRLRKAIETGIYTPGDLLPTEIELCAQHQVSRHTARDALRLLNDEGLIERKRGSGTVVIAAKPTGPFSQDWGDVGGILQYARDARLVIQSYGPPKPALLEAMSLDPSQDWIEASGIRQRIAGGPLLALTQICVRADLMPSRAALEAWPDAIAEFIAQNSGVVASRIEQEISAVRLDKTMAKSLGEHVGDPALRTLRRYIAKSGQAFQASISLHPGDRFSYRMAIER